MHKYVKSNNNKHDLTSYKTITESCRFLKAVVWTFKTVQSKGNTKWKFIFNFRKFTCSCIRCERKASVALTLRKWSGTTWKSRWIYTPRNLPHWQQKLTKQNLVMKIPDLQDDKHHSMNAVCISSSSEVTMEEKHYMIFQTSNMNMILN